MRQKLKTIIQNNTPRTWNISEPVAQVYYNKNGICSYYSFTNFPSLFSPATACDYYYMIKIYDAYGKLAASKKLLVPRNASIFFDPVKEFGSGLPETGMLTAQIKPPGVFYNKDNHLGKLTAHFYVMFGDANMNSIGVVHPQSKLKKMRAGKFREWNSNQIIETEGLVKITSVQLNPTNKPIESTLSLVSENGSLIGSKVNPLPAYGAVENVWSNFGAAQSVNFKADKLAAPNAKPLLFLHFASNSFTVSHS